MGVFITVESQSQMCIDMVEEISDVMEGIYLCADWLREVIGRTDWESLVNPGVRLIETEIDTPPKKMQINFVWNIFPKWSNL